MRVCVRVVRQAFVEAQDGGAGRDAAAKLVAAQEEAARLAAALEAAERRLAVRARFRGLGESALVCGGVAFGVRGCVALGACGRSLR